MDKNGNLVLDIEGLTHTSDKCCSGSPKVMVSLNFSLKCGVTVALYIVLDMKRNSLKVQFLFCFFILFQRALSRKGSNRMDRRGGEEYETEDGAKKLIVKGAYFQYFYFFIRHTQNHSSLFFKPNHERILNFKSNNVWTCWEKEKAEMHHLLVNCSQLLDNM